jgi:hypothetical protein
MKKPQTFEQWWDGLKNKPIPQLKPDFAACWNAALDAVLYGEPDHFDCSDLPVSALSVIRLKIKNS